MIPENRHYFSEIDGLRALAVFSVIIYHFDETIITGGFLGVDIFFVISGFLITKNITEDMQRGVFSFCKFYYRRIRRLFPAMFVTLAITSVFAFLLLSPNHFERFSGSVVFATFSLSNFYFFGEAGYFDTSSSFKPLLHFWSLAVEEQFYLFWPLTLLIFTKLKSSFFIIAGLIILSVISIVLSEMWLDINPAAPFFLTPFRIAEFAIGALCVWVIKSQRKEWQSEMLFLLGLILIFYCIFSYTSKTEFPGINSLLPCLGAALVIIGNKARYCAIVLRNPFMIRSGEISYSLYLIHWPLFVLYTYWAFSPISGLEKIILFIVTFILAELMYRYIEQKFRYRSSNIVLPGKPFFITLTTIVVLILAPVVHAWSNNGWEWRINANQDIASEANNYGCSDTKEISRFEHTCTLGESKGERPKILLVGNSHAMHLTTGLDYVAKNNNLEILFSHHSGCPPIWGTYKLQDSNNRDSETSCKQMVPKWEKMISSGEFDIVMIAARWMWLYEPNHYGEVNVRRELLVDQKNPINNVGASRELFEERLLMTINKIHEAGSRVIIFSQPPLLAKDIQDCNEVPSYLYTETRYSSRCDGEIDYNVAMKRLQFTNSFIKKLGNKLTLTLLPSDYMCDHKLKNCFTVIEDANLYKDDNHLSKEGSLLLAKYFEKEIIRFIEQ